MNVLVTGGAGYIGSHAVRQLLREGHALLVFDDYSHGHPELLQAACSEFPERVQVLAADIGDRGRLVAAMQEHGVEAILHFAAFIEVGESVAQPLLYYRNNLCNALALLQAALDCGVRRFVFSSTAAVYGNPLRTPIEETDPRAPINPYGRAKLAFELALEDACAAHGIGYAILRYFNVAGASPDALLGEWHEPETHLIPRVLAAALDPVLWVAIYGDDYPTRDGTCIRDYVHVEDLVAAHLLALKAIRVGTGHVYNLGSEAGFSVREVITACERVTGRAISVHCEPRRAGDPAVLVASSQRIRDHLCWERRYPQLDSIIAHAWAWQLRLRGPLPGPIVGTTGILSG